MHLNANMLLRSIAGAAMRSALTAGAQTPAPAPADSSSAAPAAAAAQAPAAARSGRTRSRAHMERWPHGSQRLIDGYYSFNFNRPNTTDDYDQLNQLYNFNDKTDQFELSAAKLTLNHDPDPIGAHVDFIYGRTNDLINAAPTNTDSPISSTTSSRHS